MELHPGPSMDVGATASRNRTLWKSSSCSWLTLKGSARIESLISRQRRVTQITGRCEDHHCNAFPGLQIIVQGEVLAVSAVPGNSRSTRRFQHGVRQSQYHR